MNPSKPLVNNSDMPAGLPTSTVSSFGKSNPSFSFRFSSDVSTHAATKNATATIKPNVFKKLKLCHSTPNQSLKT